MLDKATLMPWKCTLILAQNVEKQKITQTEVMPYPACICTCKVLSRGIINNNPRKLPSCGGDNYINLLKSFHMIVHYPSPAQTMPKEMLCGNIQKLIYLHNPNIYNLITLTKKDNHLIDKVKEKEDVNWSSVRNVHLHLIYSPKALGSNIVCSGE